MQGNKGIFSNVEVQGWRKKYSVEKVVKYQGRKCGTVRAGIDIVRCTILKEYDRNGQARKMIEKMERVEQKRYGKQEKERRALQIGQWHEYGVCREGIKGKLESNVTMSRDIYFFYLFIPSPITFLLSDKRYKVRQAIHF